MRRWGFTFILNIIKYMPFPCCLKIRNYCYRKILRNLGKHSQICDAVTILNPSSVSIGDYVSIHEYTTIGGAGSVSIGHNVAIASHCHIASDTHNFSDGNRPIKKQGITPKPVIIEDDVWIGTHVVILGGVKIGAGAVVGAGSVVTKDIPPYATAYGVPCEVKMIRSKGD